MSEKPAVIWAYAYRLEPPQEASRLREVKALLAREHHTAKDRSGTWEGRLVDDERVSHILVLSDSPDLTGDSNRRLESALQAINAHFKLTVPMIVPVEPAEDIPPED
jgi:hypothetical protein